MGRNANTNTNTNNSKGKEKDAFIEFAYSSGANAANGRIYLDNEKSTDTYSIVPISLELNGLVIKGCRVYIPRDNEDRGPGIMFPAFKNKDGEYIPYMFMYEKDDIAFLKELAKRIADKCK